VRPFFVRLTVRRSMIGVAAFGLIFGGFHEIQRRRARFEILAGYHWRKYPGRFCSFVPITYPPHQEWHAQMSEKYRLAASQPWLPVAPDSPPPPEIRKRLCLCGLLLSATDPALRCDRFLIQEFLERKGWETIGGATLEDENRFSVSGCKGVLTIGSEGTSEDGAWRRVFDQVEALP
jgi:hypothetical protein